MLDFLINGILTCLEPINILAICLSVPLGIIIGALPGFGAATGLVLVLPLTYTFEPGTAFVALTGIYLGCEYGGCISSILINTPGTAAAIVTGFDGFPLAKSGKAREALLLSNVASFSGGMLGGIAMLFFMPVLGNFVLKFGSGEVFLLAALGLFLVGSISKGDLLKGVASAALGLFFTLFGAESVTGFSRFDFDIPILIGGLPIIAGMLAMFAVPQMFELGLMKQLSQENLQFGETSIRQNFILFRKILASIYRQQKINIIRSSAFGILVGMIPGVGASVASMAAYGSAKKYSKTPETFGKGEPEGIVASESANNALVGGSLIPVLSLGIPGSPAAAIYMAAIFLHGMAPGPNFLIKQGDLVYILIVSIFFCSIAQLIIGALTIGSLSAILKVPASRLFPLVIAICCIGTYVSRGQNFDIEFFIVLGIASYFLRLLGFNMGAIVLGAFLGNTMEVSLNEMLDIAPAMGGIIPYFGTRPIACGMLACIAGYSAYLLYKFIRRLKCRGMDQEECHAVGLWSGVRGWDLATGIILITISVYFYITAQDYPRSSRVFPQAVLSVIILCMGMLCVKSIFMGTLYNALNDSPFKNQNWIKLGIMIGLLLIYCMGITWIGFYSCTFLFTGISSAILSVWEGGKPNLRNIRNLSCYALAATGILYFIFTVGLGTKMPAELFI